MAGKQRSAWPGFWGGTGMKNTRDLLETKSNVVYTESGNVQKESHLKDH